MLVCQAHTTIYRYDGCFHKWWYPQSHTPSADHFEVGKKPMGLLGKTHHFRVHPHMYTAHNNCFCLVLPGFEVFLCGFKTFQHSQVVLVSLGSLTVEYRWDVPEHKWLDNGSTLRRPKVRGDESWGHQFWGPSDLQNPCLRWWCLQDVWHFFFNGIVEEMIQFDVRQLFEMVGGKPPASLQETNMIFRNPLKCWDIPTWMIWVKTDLVGGTLDFGVKRIYSMSSSSTIRRCLQFIHIRTYVYILQLGHWTCGMSTKRWVSSFLVSGIQ